MSRVGKTPITIPQGVQVTIASGAVSLQGKAGKLKLPVPSGIVVKSENGIITLECTSSDKQAKADFGTTRALLNNMVKGLAEGFEKNLEFNGVGYVAKVAGQNLTLSVGFSHDVKFVLPSEIQASVEKNLLKLKSYNHALLGGWAAKIRKVQPPEPYLGKGIKYVEEKIRRKAGKTAKGKGK